MPSDANMQVIAISVGSLSATQSSSGKALNTPRRGMKLRVTSAGGSAASGSFTGQFSIDVSYDGGSTWQATQYQTPALTFTTTSNVQETNIPFEVSETTVGTPTQVRLVYTKASGSGSGHTGSFQGDIVLGRPS